MIIFKRLVIKGKLTLDLKGKLEHYHTASFIQQLVIEYPGT